MRNPSRFSVGAATGHLWIADVGQARTGEVSRIRAGDGGENLGWSCREGGETYDLTQCREEVDTTSRMDGDLRRGPLRHDGRRRLTSAVTGANL